MFGKVYLGFLGLEVKSEEQTNLTVLEGRFDWRQIVGVRNMLFGAIWCYFNGSCLVCCFMVCCLVVGSGEKWNKGIDRYEVGMLWYRQKSR